MISTAQKDLLNRFFTETSKQNIGDLINFQVYTSSASAGGAATEVMTLTGLGASDEIVAVHQSTKGANNLPLLGWSTQAANALTAVWSANPGAGAVIKVFVLKAAS